MIRYRYYLLFLLVYMSMPVLSQPVTDSIRFDHYVNSGNNDLVNYFSNTSWIQQVTTSGITGGALQPPDSISWGNDLITYCRKDDNLPDSNLVATVCFKYNSSMVSPTAFQRAADIWLFSNVVNHWLIFSVNYNQNMTILGYAANATSAVSLTNGHWYRMVVVYNSQPSVPPGDWFSSLVQLFDLGTTGLSTPTVIGQTMLTDHDLDMVQSDLDIKVSGARFGGGELLDDFFYHGNPASSTCILTGLAPVPDAKALKIYPQPAADVVRVELEGFGEEADLMVYDATGRCLLQRKGERFPAVLNTASLSDGCYFLEVHTTGGIIRKEWMVANQK